MHTADHLNVLPHGSPVIRTGQSVTRRPESPCPPTVRRFGMSEAIRLAIRLGLTFTLWGGALQAADPSAPSAGPPPSTAPSAGSPMTVTPAAGEHASADGAAAGREARTERRIRNMHTRLQITEAQEALWSKVTSVMRQDARTMDELIQARALHARSMTAVEDLQSYGEVTDAHATGIKQLTQAFTPLYASMSDSQKKAADTLFRSGEHRATAHKTASHS